MTTAAYMSQPWGTSTIPAQGSPLPPPIGPPPLELAAATPAAGFALQNGTPTILSWTAPADGLNHTVWCVASLAVSAAETGGLVAVASVAPDGTTGQSTLESAGQGIGQHPGQLAMVVQPGSTFQVQQTSALTLGAATLWAHIWAA